MYNDKPIEKIKQDELGMETFIKNLSKAIINSFESEEPIDSLTIGLMGEWGYGKTSCLNMIIENLKNEDKDIKIIEFNPWIYSSYNQLTEYFFNELIYGLEDEDNDLRMNLNKYLNRYKVKTNRIDQIKKIGRGSGIDFFKEFIGKNSQEENLKIYKDNINDKLKDYKILCIIDNIDRLSKEEIIDMFQLIKKHC